MVVQAALNLHDINAGDAPGSDAKGESKTTTANHPLHSVKSSGESGNTLKRKSLFPYYDTTGIIKKNSVLILWMKSMKR